MAGQGEHGWSVLHGSWCDVLSLVITDSTVTGSFITAKILKTNFCITHFFLLLAL